MSDLSCRKCGEQIGPDEMVWRVRVVVVNYSRRYSAVQVWPMCAGCRPEEYSHPLRRRHYSSGWEWEGDTGRSIGEGRRYSFEESEPCEACGRPVVNEPEMNIPGTRKYTACNWRCRRKVYTKKRKERREAKRSDMECGQCGRTFTPDRSDAKWCSDACKMKAYRRRKAAGQS